MEIFSSNRCVRVPWKKIRCGDSVGASPRKTRIGVTDKLGESLVRICETCMHYVMTD